MEDIKEFTFDRNKEAFDKDVLEWTTLWLRNLRARKIKEIKNTYVVDMFPCEHLRKQFNIEIGFTWVKDLAEREESYNELEEIFHHQYIDNVFNRNESNNLGDNDLLNILI